MASSRPARRTSAVTAPESNKAGAGGPTPGAFACLLEPLGLVSTGYLRCSIPARISRRGRSVSRHVRCPPSGGNHTATNAFLRDWLENRLDRRVKRLHRRHALGCSLSAESLRNRFQRKSERIACLLCLPAHARNDSERQIFPSLSNDDALPPYHPRKRISSAKSLSLLQPACHL